MNPADINLTNTFSSLALSTAASKASSINPVRLDKIARALSECSFHKFSQAAIEKFCFCADEVKPGKIIHAVKSNLDDRTIFRDANGRKWVFLTRTKIGEDKKIGEGSYKKVKYAVDLDTGEKEALSILKYEYCQDLDPPLREKEWEYIRSKDGLKHELQMMKECREIEETVKLDTSHFDHQKEKYYILTDLCDKDLFDLIVDEKPSNQQIRTIIRELASGLQKMHHKNLLHLDIKLDNIFLKKGHVKIGDFGFSCKMNDDEKTKKSQGTLGYFPPEKFRLERSTDKCDVWSFGCVIFGMLAGVSLFTDEQQMHLKMIAEDGKWLPSVDAAIEDHINKSINHFFSSESFIYRPLLQGVLQVNPTKRWSIDQFIDEFDKTFDF